MTSVCLTSADGWADKYLLDIPYRNGDISEEQHYGYRAIEYIYHFGQGIDVLADAMYEYRHYTINTYELDEVYHYKTRCVNAIRIYSVPTGDDLIYYIAAAGLSGALSISAPMYLRKRRKNAGCNS